MLLTTTITRLALSKSKNMLNYQVRLLYILSTSSLLVPLVLLLLDTVNNSSIQSNHDIVMCYLFILSSRLLVHVCARVTDSQSIIWVIIMT